MPSENGWEPAVANDAQCEWIVVPGTDPPVHLELLKGQPLIIMRAYAADYNAYVEHLRDADSGGRTLTNNVPTSNHLNGTAMDLNWNGADGNTFRLGISKERAYPGNEARNLDELIEFYEEMIFCGGNWDIQDWMHMQMGGDTYGSANVARVQNFIARKIRADGFSTFRREGIPVPPPPPMPREDRYALLIIAEGRRRGITPRGIQIALATALVESNLTIYANERVPESMSIPHDAVGSDAFSVGIFQQQVRDTGNGWWWGDAATCMDPTLSAGLFYDRLAKLDYNGPNSPGSYAQAVQSSAFPDRYDQRFGDAVVIYNRLAGLQPPPPPGPTGEDMALVPQDQWDRVYRELTQRLPSRSPLRHLDEGVVDTMAGFLLNTDSSVHVEIVKTLASLGHRPSLALLWDVAHADPVKYPDRQSDRDIAQRILADVTSNTAAVTSESASAPAQLAAAYAEIARLRQEIARLQALPGPVSTEVAVVDTAAPAKSSGERVGKLVDSIEDWTQLSLDMNVKQRAALAASIKVLEMNTNSNGAQQ